MYLRRILQMGETPSGVIHALLFATLVWLTSLRWRIPNLLPEPSVSLCVEFGCEPFDQNFHMRAGVSNTEVWNNLGLCCFYASQYDMALSCFDHAFVKAQNDEVADVWYNIGHLAIGKFACFVGSRCASLRVQCHHAI